MENSSTCNSSTRSNIFWTNKVNHLYGTGSQLFPDQQLKLLNVKKTELIVFTFCYGTDQRTDRSTPIASCFQFAILLTSISNLKPWDILLKIICGKTNLNGQKLIFRTTDTKFVKKCQKTYTRNFGPSHYFPYIGLADPATGCYVVPKYHISNVHFEFSLDFLFFSYWI